MSVPNTTRAANIRKRPYTHEMVLVHRVFRRESSLLPRLVRTVRAGDTARAAGTVAAV
jgi:hypothetical protein